MTIVIEQETKTALQQVYEHLTGKPSDLRRGCGTTLKHAPDRTLKAHEAGKPLPTPYPEQILKKFRDAHRDYHIDQGGRFLDCPFCRGDLFFDEVPTPPIPVKQRDYPDRVPDGTHGEVISKKIVVLKERVSRTNSKDGFCGANDEITRDYGDAPVDFSTKGWRSFTCNKLYFCLIPSPMVPFARWFMVSLFPGRLKARSYDPPDDASQFVKYAYAILGRSRQKILQHGFEIPSDEQVKQLLQQIPTV